MDVRPWAGWGLDLGRSAAVDNWAIAGETGAVLRGARRGRRTQAVLLVGSEQDKERATASLTATGRYARAPDVAPLDPTWQAWSRDVVTDREGGQAQVAIVSAPWSQVARPMIEQARAHPVQGVPVPAPAELVALGVLAPEGSVGTLSGPQVVELVSTLRGGWTDAGQTFDRIAGTLPEINRVTLGQAIWERWEEEESRYYPNGRNRLRDLQTRLQMGPQHLAQLPEIRADLQRQADVTSVRSTAGRQLSARLAQVDELQEVWNRISNAPGAWWSAMNSYTQQLPPQGLGRGIGVWGPVRQTFLHGDPRRTGPSHGHGH
ncbi:MAG TPA: hypothetical protein VIA06_04040 [Candidatus Dormibacteraeota bacterium]|nr:hypothetical protein [Candidatus Dormibacteraeota bacterium]